MTPATGWHERDYFAAVRNARAAFDRANPQLMLGVLESAGTWEAAPAVSSASDDGVLVPGESTASGSGRDDASACCHLPGLTAPTGKGLSPSPSPGASAPSDGNPRGHPPDDQRIPALSPSGRGRDNGALDLTTSGPPAPPPKEDSGRAEGGHSK